MALAHLIYGFEITSAERQKIMQRHSIPPDDKDFEIDVNLTSAWNLHLLQNPITEEPETNPIPVIVLDKNSRNNKKESLNESETNNKQVPLAPGENETVIVDESSEGGTGGATTTTTTTKREGDLMLEVVIIEDNDSRSKSEQSADDEQPPPTESKQQQPQQDRPGTSTPTSSSPSQNNQPAANNSKVASLEEEEDEWKGLKLSEEEKKAMESEGQSFGLTFRTCGGWEADINAGQVLGEASEEEELVPPVVVDQQAGSDDLDEEEEDTNEEKQIHVEAHKKADEEVVIITEEETPVHVEEHPSPINKSAELSAELEQTMHKDELFAARKQVQDLIQEREHFVVWWEETSFMGEAREVSINQLRAVVKRSGKKVEQRRLQEFFGWAGIEPRPARWIVAASTLPVEPEDVDGSS